MKKILWLDDLRNPYDGNWLQNVTISKPFNVIWVKCYDEFVNYINENGVPDFISFDHDLGMTVAMEATASGLSKRKARKLKTLEKTGYDCTKWLIEYCLEFSVKFPDYSVHSQNPIGKQNIISLIENFKKHEEKNT